MTRKHDICRHHDDTSSPGRPLHKQEYEFLGPWIGPVGIMLGLPGVCYALVYTCNAGGGHVFLMAGNHKSFSGPLLLRMLLLNLTVWWLCMHHAQDACRWKPSCNPAAISLSLRGLVCAGCDALRGPFAWPGFPKGSAIFTWEACAVLLCWLAFQVCLLHPPHQHV